MGGNAKWIDECYRDQYLNSSADCDEYYRHTPNGRPSLKSFANVRLFCIKFNIKCMKCRKINSNNRFVNTKH